MSLSVLAAEGGYQRFVLAGGEWGWLIFSAAVALLAILVGLILVRGVLAADQGTPKMQEIAKAIQEGAMAYLRRQFRTIAFILVPVAGLVFLSSTEVLSSGARRPLSPGFRQPSGTPSLIAGAFPSGLTGLRRDERGCGA